MFMRSCKLVPAMLEGLLQLKDHGLPHAAMLRSLYRSTHLRNLSFVDNRMRKLMYRVVFPFDLKLRNTTEDCPDADQPYSLFAVVVHVGSGPNHGITLLVLYQYMP